MMDMALRSNPQMRAMIDANPHMASMLHNPQFLQVGPTHRVSRRGICCFITARLQSMMNPQTLRAVSQAQQQVPPSLRVAFPFSLTHTVPDGRYGHQSDARFWREPDGSASASSCRPCAHATELGATGAMPLFARRTGPVLNFVGAVFVAAAAAGGYGILQPRPESASAGAYWRQRRSCCGSNSFRQLQLIVPTCMSL